MSTISIINLILISAVIALLFFGLLLCCKYSQNNIYKKYLIGTIAFWIMALSWSYYWVFFANVESPASVSFDMLNMRGLLFGIPCFLTLVSLPIVVLNDKLLKLVNWIKLAMPIAIAVAIYFGYHLIAGSDPFHKYYSGEEILQNITTAPVIMRILIHLCFLIYITIVMGAINYTVPLYNQYIKDNIADSDYNVDWVSGMVRRVWLITVLYFLIRVTGSIYTVAPYLISVMIGFIYIIDMSLFHKMMEGITPLTLDVSREVGWRFFESDESSHPVVASESAYLEQRWGLIKGWMESERPFTNPEFTMHSVAEHFSEITPAELSEIFKLHGDSFQSIVREFRIAYACEIIKQQRGDISSKMLYMMVGFSYHSSFSRAFAAVQGVTSSEYIKAEREACDSINVVDLPPPPRKRVKR